MTKAKSYRLRAAIGSYGYNGGGAAEWAAKMRVAEFDRRMDARRAARSRPSQMTARVAVVAVTWGAALAAATAWEVLR